MIFEKTFLNSSTKLLIGTDEAGRGPLAGPVVAAAVAISSVESLEVIHEELLILGVNDSKKVSPLKRKKIINSLEIDLDQPLQEIYIKGQKLIISSDSIPPKIIDKLNILKASLLAMKSCCEKIMVDSMGEVVILCDGNKSFDHQNDVKVFPIIKGDQKSLLIALASIVAKEKRDQEMLVLDGLYPEYGLKNHYGYPTKAHQASLKKFGPSPIHRQSFRLEY